MKRNFWPYAIVLYFIVFIGAIAAWIVFATHNDQELVRKDYYDQEILFQKEIDNRARAAALNVKISYDAIEQSVRIDLPSQVSQGTVYFYRAAHAKLDREFPLVLNDGVQSIDVRNFERGLWKVRLHWLAEGVEFRHDQSLVFASKTLSAL